MKKYTIGNKIIKAESEGLGTIVEAMPTRSRLLYNGNRKEHGLR